MRLALVPLLTGCIIIDPSKDCDASAVGSVALTVSASDGGDVSEAQVSWTSDGRTYQPCDAFPGDGEWVCGWEAAGDIGVRVEADGYQAFERTVFVEQGECHVVPVHLEVALVPEDVDCTDVEMPSVLATVEGSSGEALENVAVSWARTETPEDVAACEQRDDGAWVCGWEVAGALEVRAEASGHVPQVLTADVRADECHVFTETLAFRLEWGAD